MLQVSPACFCFFLQCPLWNYYLFLIFPVCQILHCFYECAHKIAHPYHFSFIYFYLLLQFSNFPFRLTDFKHLLCICSFVILLYHLGLLIIYSIFFTLFIFLLIVSWTHELFSESAVILMSTMYFVSALVFIFIKIS